MWLWDMMETYHSNVIGVSFWTYRRRRRVVLMGGRGYVPLRRLGDVPLRHRWVFIYDLFETSWRRTDWTSLFRPLQTSSRRSNKTSWRSTIETSCRRSIETSLGVSFGTHLRRHWDVQRDVVTTSPRRFVAGWVSS